MAEKFGKARWVKEGYLDNRVPGVVVGRITFAAIGTIDICLKGDCRGELAGKAFRFKNSRFFDEDVAAHALGDFETPQIGEVSLISFDPHPLLAPHPYIEWFSNRNNHYRIELEPADAWILDEAQAGELDPVSANIRTLWTKKAPPPGDRDDSQWV